MSMFDFPHPKDKVVILQRIPVFSECTEEQLNLIAQRTRLLEIKKGEFVYRQGDVADAFYIVISGRLRIFANNQTATEKVIGILHNDESFGEISLLTGERHSANVQAINDTLVLQLQKSDFDDVINRIPSLVLYLSRVLSKRLRVRERDGEFSEATIAAAYSAAQGVGCTLFSLSLAYALGKETREPLVYIDLSGSETSRPFLYSGGKPKAMDDPELAGMLTHSRIDEYLQRHPMGFHMLYMGNLRGHDRGAELIAPLLSMLTKRFRYVLLDLPSDVDRTVFKALTQSDLIYFVTDPNQNNVIKTKALLERVRTSVGLVGQQVKIVLNMRRNQSKPTTLLGLLLTPREQMDKQQVASQLEEKVDFVLPHVSEISETISLEKIVEVLDAQVSPYALNVRRIARDLAGTLVGLAFGSGAALGLAHIGILKVLEREKIPIDMVAGTSIGAMVGGLWASGKTADELEAMALRFKNPWNVRRLFLLDISVPVSGLITASLFALVAGLWGGIWSGFFLGVLIFLMFILIVGPLSGGPIQGQQLMKTLEEDFAGAKFEDCRIPLQIVAANPMGREEIVFDSGLIAEAVRSSVSIPGIFKPTIRRGRICLDGGVLNPVPISTLKESGAHRVIAINVFPTTPEIRANQENSKKRREEREAIIQTKSFPIRFLAWLRQELVRAFTPLVFDVIMRSMQAMEHQIAEIACHDADLTLRPTVPGSHWLEFYHPEKFIKRGEEVALQRLPEIKRLVGLQNDGSPDVLEPD